LIVGLTAGLNTVLVPIYLSEIAPVRLRGGIGVLNQLAVTLGIFIGQVAFLYKIYFKLI
jgi:MFS transporter, SP family, solute carrier family 2 (facilitated glucose transporter), member 3